MPERALRRLDAAGLDPLRARLRAAGLPADDLDGARMHVFALEDAAGALAWAALETTQGDALLRSVLVLPDRRAKGVGADLVRHIAAEAASRGIARLWLLTETAAPFFGRHGFRAVERAAAPAAIRQTSEFRAICPASATCMVRDLARP